MGDFATSSDPAVQGQLDRLGSSIYATDVLGLERISALLDKLGRPQDRLPPVFHVAGTNGKGSTCAYLRAMLEAEGLTAHAATKPHLVRYNERIRIAGELVSDAELAALLKRGAGYWRGARAELLRGHHRGDLTRLRAPSGGCLRDRSRARRALRRDQRARTARRLRHRHTRHRSRGVPARARGGDA